MLSASYLPFRRFSLLSRRQTLTQARIRVPILNTTSSLRTNTPIGCRRLYITDSSRPSTPAIPSTAIYLTQIQACLGKAARVPLPPKLRSFGSSTMRTRIPQRRKEKSSDFELECMSNSSPTRTEFCGTYIAPYSYQALSKRNQLVPESAQHREKAQGGRGCSRCVWHAQCVLVETAPLLIVPAVVQRRAPITSSPSYQGSPFVAEHPNAAKGSAFA